MSERTASGRLTVLRCGTGPPSVVSALRSALAEHDLRVCPVDRVAEFVHEADVVIPARARVTEAVLAKAERCRLIQQMGTGVDAVDLDAAARRGIPVANVPSGVSGAAESVAEHALFLILGSLRNQPALADAVTTGRWSDVPVARTITNSTVGIVGLGDIGSTLARMLRPFECRIIGIKRRPDPELAGQLHLDRLGGLDDLPYLLGEADILVLALPMTPETAGVIGAEQLAMMRPGSYLINVARSGLVDKSAMLHALASGRLRGVGLDVFWDEPAEPDDPVLAHNAFVTPHAAGYTELMLGRACAVVAANITRLMASEPLHHVVA